MGKTAIEWTDYSWNPIRAARLQREDDRVSTIGKLGWHCEHVSEGCRNCYAEVINRRLGTGFAFKPSYRLRRAPDVSVFLDKKMLLAPLRWKSPRRIFVCSMTDIGAPFVTDGMLDRIFAVMALCPQHTFMMLTKRPERLRAYIDNAFDRVVLEMMFSRELYKLPTVKETCEKYGLPFTQPQDGSDWWPLRNVWLGMSCEDQSAANQRIPHLLATPASIRFLSCEPLLGPINLTQVTLKSEIKISGHEFTHFNALTAIGKYGCGSAGQLLNWVIVGGESGPNARPMHPCWARTLRDQCAAAEVPFFFKQWGEWAPMPAGADESYEASRARGASDMAVMKPDLCVVERIGKKRAGRLLDGVEHNAFPGDR
ncbi:MAG: phage Gp37/Gp68 family protein [Alphaproteobacteria bacterium]|nr:phage Gp37/Gp68 family protein [Alphaproteobacteria bacterium]